MDIFIDTSNVETISEWDKTGIISGVTTNPALLSQEKGNPIEILSKIASIMDKRPVSAQVTHSDSESMVKQGIKLSQIANNIIIKLPANHQGFLTQVKFAELGINTNITLCFDPVTASLFAKAGATYVSMILGRTDDFNLQQSDLVLRTKKIFTNLETKTKILAASFRSPHQVELAMSQGADVLTIPPKTLEMALENPLTNSGLGDFSKAWDGLTKEDRSKYDEC